MTLGFEIPHGCVPIKALHTLASVMIRLASWHSSHGGQAPDEPCLRGIRVEDDGSIVARVTSDKLEWRLLYVGGEWRESSLRRLGSSDEQ